MPKQRKEIKRYARAFAALGDETRLTLLSRLARAEERTSIAQLAARAPITRQAVRKHLQVLEEARLVRCVRAGRELLYEIDPEPVLDLREYLDRVSTQWDNALARLKMYVESAAEK